MQQFACCIVQWQTDTLVNAQVDKKAEGLIMPDDVQKTVTTIHVQLPANLQLPLNNWQAASMASANSRCYKSSNDSWDSHLLANASQVVKQDWQLTQSVQKHLEQKSLAEKLTRQDRQTGACMNTWTQRSRTW
jgi:hypothetical protein